MKAFLAIFLFILAAPVFAASSFEIDGLGDKYHVTADRTLYHSRERVYEAFGHVVVSSQGQRLSCDYLWLDERSMEIKARGNVLFVDDDSTIEAAELHFNLQTGVGSIFYGRVSNDLYALRGQLIRKVSNERFLTTEGEYTTCKDCPESWKLSARNVDMTIEGYAFMDSVFLKIKDIPTLFVPYLIVPVKTKRQSGLLFPRLGADSNHGFVAVQPLYLTLGQHQDMTLAFGKYSSRGLRYEFEHRYKGPNGIEGQFNFFRTNDRKVSFGQHRTAFYTNQKLPISDHLNVRLRAYEVMDRDYPYDFPEDILGANLPALESNAVATAPFDDFFVSVEAKRYRNLLYAEPTGFDTGTVQALPTVHLGVRERPVFGPILAGLYARYDVFRRHNGSFFDTNVVEGQRYYNRDEDMIRETNRLIAQPVISAPFRVGDILRISPSLTFNETRYSFSVPTVSGGVPNTQTRYLLARVDASTVLERVFDFNSETVSRIKHQMSPFLTFSNIPMIDQGETSHPFNGALGQLEKPAGLFDQYDIVPLTNDTNFLRYPQGKSIYYGFTSRLIRKMKTAEERAPKAYPFDLVKPKPRTYPQPQNRKQELEIEANKRWDQFAPHYDQYQEIWTLNVSQAYDFKSAKRFNQDRKRAFSYLLAKSDVNVDQFSQSLEYRYFPRVVSRELLSSGLPGLETVYANKHFISTSFTWYLQNLTNLRKTRSFVRSVKGRFTNSSHPNPSRTIGGELNWSFTDFVNTRLVYDYDLLSKKQLGWSAQTVLTHHSECWGILVRYDWLRNRGTGSRNSSNIGFQLLLNLMGTGFMGYNEGDSGPGGVFGGM